MDLKDPISQSVNISRWKQNAHWWFQVRERNFRLKEIRVSASSHPIKVELSPEAGLKAPHRLAFYIPDAVLGVLALGCATLGLSTDRRTVHAITDDFSSPPPVHPCTQLQSLFRGWSPQRHPRHHTTLPHKPTNPFSPTLGGETKPILSVMVLWTQLCVKCY